MIKMIRIDERLVHGQVALIWTRHLSVDRIIVINDKVAANPTLTATLKMAAPDSVKCIVLGVEKGIQLLNDPRTEPLKILVVINNADDAKIICQNVSNIPLLNVGNYGRADGNLESKEKVTDNLFLTDKDKEDFREIFKTGVTTKYQIVPDQPITDMKEFIK